MAQMSRLKMVDVGEALFAALSEVVARAGLADATEVAIQANSLHESITIFFPDGSRFHVKAFPHKNLKNEAIFRLEAHQYRPGEHRGGRIGTADLFPRVDHLSEVRSFVEGMLKKAGVAGT